MVSIRARRLVGSILLAAASWFAPAASMAQESDAAAAAATAPSTRRAAAQVDATRANTGDGMFEEPLVAGVALVHDNDNLPHPGNTLRDDNYSAAYELRLSGRFVDAARLTAPLSALDRLSRLRRAHARGQLVFHSAQVIGIVYTPDRIDTSDIQVDDRPYASLVAVTVGRTSVGGPNRDRAWASALSFGMLGLALPGELQRLIHRTRRWMTGKRIPVDPRGWDNQIAAGGEPTALYRVGYQRRVAGDGAAAQRKHWEVVGALDGEAGYSVSASGAVSLRVGAFTSDFWEFPRGVASPATHQAPPTAGVPRWDVMAFALLRPRVVAYNALVQGQFKDSPYTVGPRHLLGEWEGGVGLSIPIRASRLQAVVQFAQGRTPDFDRPKARAYTWGTVGLFLSKR